MSMSTATLEQAIASTRAVLAGVKPDQLGADTPCASWKVTELINHMVGGQFFFAAMANGEAPSDEPSPDFAAGDFLGTFDHAGAACVAAFSADGVMEKTLHLPFGDMPGAAFILIAATDTFAHGWDLARATGQNADLDPALAHALLEDIRPALSDGFRGAEGQAPFVAAQTAPDGACNADQLAAFLGRTV
jgi:uncharacterized protein (TIGR03086 family)